MNVKVQIVLLKDPCSACFIICGLVKEIFDKLKKEMDFIVVTLIELENFKGLHKIEGLEVERFPAIIINGEQLTAGTIPNKNELIKRLLWESENSEY